MDNLDYYKGKDIKQAIEVSGRRYDTQHFVIAAVLRAAEEHLSAEQIVKLVYAANQFKPEKVDHAKNIAELGF